MLECEQVLVDAIELAIDKPTEFVTLAQDDKRAFAKEVGRIIAINEVALTNTVRKMTGMDLDYRITSQILENIEENGFAHRMATAWGHLFAIECELMRAFRDLGVLSSLCLGEPYIIQQCATAVKRISVRSSNGDEDTGTGFVARLGKRKYLITCNHVIFEADGSPREILSVEAAGVLTMLDVPLSFERIDVCLFELDSEPSEGFPLRSGEILTDIITAGYPRVRMREGNPLLFHKGQLNGWTESELDWERAGIVSAAVAPGSSGGPVLNGYGAVVGVVDQQIETRHQTGTTTYNAMLPSEIILNEMGRYNRARSEAFLRAKCGR